MRREGKRWTLRRERFHRRKERREASALLDEFDFTVDNPNGIDYDSVKIPDKVIWCGRPNCRCVRAGKADEKQH